MDQLRTGARMPFLGTDITHYVDLAASDFSPIENQPAALTDTQEDVYIKNGFIAENATDTAGLLYVVTWNEFQIHRQRSNRALVTNTQVLALCTPIQVYVASGSYCMTPLVKVYATTDQSYPSVVTKVNILTIR